MKVYTALLLLLSTVLSNTVFSQDLSFNILPLAINPAFTGMFDGSLRITGLYNNKKTATTANFLAYGASTDGRLSIRQTGYLAVGLGVLQGKISNGSLDNSSGIISVAYHKTLRRHDKKTSRPIGEIAGGIQAGYIQRSIRLQGTGNSFPPFLYHTGKDATYFIINAGLSFSQFLGKKFAYTIGISGNNLNLLNDGTANTEHPLLRVTPSGTALIIANWKTGARWAMRPAVLHIINKDFYIAGNEFRYATSTKAPANVAFIDIWYRSTKIITLTPGFEFKRLRIAAGIDYRLSISNSSGYGGFQLAARYIQPLSKSHSPESPIQESNKE